MDPRRLMTFRAVATARSFSRAAEQMSLTQPSVSHQIALLETELGVRLLERGRGGLRLTEPGAELLELAGAERIDLMQDAFLVGLPPEHPLAGSTSPISLTELADDDWIVAST